MAAAPDDIHVVALHALAPPKPAFGALCNGCGLCCAVEPCPLGMIVYRRRKGKCPALKWDEALGRYVCGLLVSSPRWLRPLISRWIAAGRGCDFDAVTG